MGTFTDKFFDWAVSHIDVRYGSAGGQAAAACQKAVLRLLFEGQDVKKCRVIQAVPNAIFNGGWRESGCIVICLTT